MTILSLTIVGVLAFGMVLVVYGTIVENNWGINLGQVDCPRCGTHLPQVRKPSSLSQTVWGGYTCSSCRTEVDKWGRELER
jgi:DNA-directed RNA polymerase subunit RPC12/RpoP